MLRYINLVRQEYNRKVTQLYDIVNIMLMVCVLIGLVARLHCYSCVTGCVIIRGIVYVTQLVHRRLVGACPLYTRTVTSYVIDLYT